MSLHISLPEDTERARIAYASVVDVPTVENNDRHRLGYHVWMFLRGELPTLEEAVAMSRARFKPRDLERETVVEIIERALVALRAEAAHGA